MSLYLITGVAGFIGSNLAHELLRRGERVRGFDNFETGKRHNLADIEAQIDFRELDLLDARGVAEACAGVDYVLHQASAYGNTPTLPKHEGMVPDPISPYAVQKLTGELYLSSFYHVYGLETVSLRYFNIFGPRQDPTSEYSGVLARFTAQMLAGRPCTIFGDGEQSRDFTYIDNAVNANLLTCKAPVEKVCGHVFNVATGTRFSLNETFRLLAGIIGYDGKPQYAAARAGDVKHSLADTSRAREAMRYQATVGFEEGLRRTVEWYKKALVPQAGVLR
jgi:nucleoside-diphosphate-sugar epimerase